MILGVDKTFCVVVISRFVNGFAALGLAFVKNVQIFSNREFLEVLT
jgi:hypothetical protein